MSRQHTCLMVCSIASWALWICDNDDDSLSLKTLRASHPQSIFFNLLTASVVPHQSSRPSRRVRSCSPCQYTS